MTFTRNDIWVALFFILLAAVAFGGCWTAYESHVANNGVAAMAAAISDGRGQRSF